jgi:hypothetical protein
MTNRFPLIVDSQNQNIKELPSGDNLDLTGNSIVGLVNLTATGNFEIGGNLTVTGTTTTIDTTTLQIEDPLIKLANGNVSSDQLSIGFYGSYGDSGEKKTGLFRSHVDGDFYLFKNFGGDITGNVIGVSGLDLANLKLGTITGNITSSSATITGGTINGTTIGATTASTGAFTTLSASTSLTTPLVTNAGTLALSATGANVVTASTNGVERLRIDSAGSVGIGTNAPASILNVVGEQAIISGGVGTGNLGIQIKGTALSEIPAGQVQGYIATGQSTLGTAGDLLIAPRTNTTASVRFITGTTPAERLRITSGGRVGIGAVNPQGQLVVSNAEAEGIEIDSTVVSGTVRLLSFNRATSAEIPLQLRASTVNFLTNNTERLRITSAGNVGIGTTIPFSKLGIGVGNNGDGIAFSLGPSNYNNIYYSRGGGKLVISTMLKGSATVNNGFESSQGGNFGKSAIEVDYGTIQFYTNPASAVPEGDAFTPTERLRITSAGDVGVGTGAPNLTSINRVITINGASNSGLELSAGGTCFGLIFANNQRLSIDTNNSGANLINFFTAGSERLRITSAGNVGIGTTSPARQLHVNGSTGALRLQGTAVGGYVEFVSPTSTTFIGHPASISSGSTDDFGFYIAGSERMRITSAGNVGIGVSAPSAKLDVLGATSDQIRLRTASTEHYAIGRNATTGFLDFFGSQSGFTGYTFGGVDGERMRIDGSGNLLVGNTGFNDSATGALLAIGGRIYGTTDNSTIYAANRLNSDGVLFEFKQDNSIEGTISVSGTTVSYNGGHLSRWSQTADKTRIALLKGTVMTNLDQMAVWGDEDNEQLNCMAVSSVEGDPNVAGVFVNWDNDDDVFTNDMNVAMTGDMIIRIAQGTAVQRGDLLMSAGDGTAKPQGDDIVRSKTIAKVTSTHVTCTYEDGSYCVPCVLMAC